MRKLPQFNFSEGFYIWFNPEAKEEYYSTPMYLYKTDTYNDMDNHRRKIIQESDFYKHKPSKKESAPKHPTSIYVPYYEQFGLFLISLLNADFSSFDSAYDTFFYLYGFELLKEYVPYKELEKTYSSEDALVKIMKRVYEDSLEELIEVQHNFKEFVNFIYNLNGNGKLKESKINSKFVSFLITHQNDVYTYSSDIEVILDTYSNKHEEYYKYSLEELTKQLDENDSLIKMTNVYTSEKLSNIVFVVLEQIVKNYNLPIKTCQYCGRYFIPSIRQDELYCDLPNRDGKSCREKGAKQTYRKNLEKIPALLEYRKAYQKKFMEVARSDNNKKLKKDFDSWKKIAQSKIRDYKQGKVTEDELYKWMIENK